MRVLWWLIVPLLVWAVEGRLVQIADGDTVVFQNPNTTITICQLAFIDAPEDHENKRLQSQITRCGLAKAHLLAAGKEATVFIKNTLELGQTYRYETLGPPQGSWAHCIVYIPKAAHAQLHPTLNGVMLDQGYGVFLPFPQPSSRASAMEKFSHAAQKEKRGLWKSHPEVMECLLSNR